MGNWLVGIRDTIIATENGFVLDINLGFEGQLWLGEGYKGRTSRR
jgi:hypothetical protein